MSSSDALAIAREKLQATDMPLVLRVSYYLRVSCSTLDSNSIRYSNLLHDLYGQNPVWLSTCTVTPAGILQSSDRTINELLHPITTLHQASQAIAQALPHAA